MLTATLPSRRSLLDECTASVRAQTIACEHLVGVDLGREGPATIRNRLAAASGADWFLPLDDDDLLDPECAELLLAASGDADVVYPWCRVVDNGPMEPWSPNRLFRPERLLEFNYIPVTALVSAELWRAVGGHPERVDHEDFRMWRRCIAEGARFRCVPEVLFTYRRGFDGSRNQWVAQAA